MTAARSTIAIAALWCATLLHAAPLAITTTTLPPAAAGQSYLAFINVSGGAAPYGWGVDGVLPPGLTTSSGIISGTPTSVGSFTFIVTVNDSGGAQTSRTFTITVSGSLAVTTANLPAAAAGAAYNTTLSASGGAPPYVWSAVSDLPPGLSLSAAGVLSGTPTSFGTFNLTVKVADAAGITASRSLSLTIGAPGLLIKTSSLPPASTGQTYNQTLQASGGTLPYRWTVTGLPAGLSYDATSGAMSGTPTASGTFPLQAQVKDANQASASANLTLIVNASPLSITTLPPLFTGVVGGSYAQTFTAVGGKPPYTWSATGDTGGLTLDASSGVLQGTPQSAGTFTFTLQVADSTGAKAGQAFTLTVNAPSLSITAGPPLAAAAVGVAYTQRVLLSATGGTPPYTWSIASGSTLPAGLAFDPNALTISGTPSTAGAFTFVVRVADSSGNTASRSLSLTVLPAALTITTARLMPDGALNGAYSLAMDASGGIPPYSWSATGLPAGLSIDSATGQISGTITAAGTFPVAITVIDSTLAHFSDRFSINVALPPTPPVTISGVPATATAAQQFGISISLASAFPNAISGQVILSFAADNGPVDRTVQFASGGTVANFSIPAGSTDSVSDVPLAIQTGTVSGTINVSVRLQAGGLDITPSPAPTATIQIPRAAPVISGVDVTRSSAAISIAVSAYSTAREVTQATFTFAATAGQTLQASSVTVPVENLFGAWFQDAVNSQYGSHFVMTQNFTINGDPNAVVPQSVTLTNRTGSVTFNIKP